MASQIFSEAKRIRKQVKNELRRAETLHGSDFDRSKLIASVVNPALEEFREILAISQLLHEVYEDVVGKKTSNWYFVTIRPKPGVTWEDFYKSVHKYVNRSFMISYTLSFEQKSITGSGEGFHVHIVCNTKHRSKGECLRDTTSTFNKVADANCVDVKPTRNPDSIVSEYLVEYKSADDHKEGTKTGDLIWRATLGLKQLYEDDLEAPGGCLSSPMTTQNSVLPLVIQLD